MSGPVAGIGDGTLTVADILRHGSTWHAARTVRTVGADAGEQAYGDVAGRAAALAHGLRALGVRPGSIVGSLLWNTREHLEMYFGVPAMGALLHTINPRLSAEQLVYTINHAADEVVVVDASFLDRYAEIADRLPTVRTVVVVGDPEPGAAAPPSAFLRYPDLVAGRPTDYAWPKISEKAPATLCFTTGTTGDPKGVAYSHRSIWIHALSLCTANAVGLNSRDCGYIITPMFHANAWGYPYATFWAGGDLLLCNRRVDAETVIGAIDRYRPTFANGVPTVWNEILSRVDADPEAGFGTLDRVILGGAPIPGTLRAGLRRYGVEALQGWGMTETSPLITMNRPPRDEENPDPERRGDGQGRVLAGVDIRLVRPDTGEVLPADGGTVGEFELRGPWVADSYYRADDGDKFRDGWLRTGDVGTLDPLGYVTLTDRAKDVIKSGGEWISSNELELAVARHPDVVQAAVIGVPDERWDERPCVLVVLREDAQATLADLRDLLLESLPKWWIPERWVRLDELPLTSVGKFDKKRMRAIYAEGNLDVQRL